MPPLPHAHGSFPEVFSDQPPGGVLIPSSGSVCASHTTPVLHICKAQVTQVRLAAIPEIDPRLKCKTVKLYGFCLQAIDSQWDIFGNRKILRFPIFLRQEIESRKSRVSIRSRAAAKQADERSQRDRFLSCGLSRGGRFRKLTHYLIPARFSSALRVRFHRGLDTSRRDRPSDPTSLC